MPKLTPILVAPAERRDAIRNKAVEGVKTFFPLEAARHVLEVKDVTLHPQDFSANEQKAALMEGRSLMEPVKGVLVLKDKAGNVIEQSRPTTLLHLPYYTDRHTFVVDGNEYSVANQVRLKPGVYTRRRGNAELESQFNLVKKGGNFSLAMEPETGKLVMKFGGSNIDLYPVLRGIGVPHAEIAQHWGHDLAAENEAKYGKKVEQAVQKLYDKMTPEYRRAAGATHEARVDGVRNWFASAKMDPKVVQQTLGVSHETVQPATLLKASQKLINVFKSAQDLDDRDSLEYKRLHSVDDFLKERLQISGRDLRRKVVFKLDRAGAQPDLKSIIPAGVFTPSVKTFLTQSDIASIPTNYNPMEVLDVSQKVTPLGEGGIGSVRAVPYEARQIHHTHLGIIDPIRTTESEASGADVRAAIHAARDEEGNLYATLWNPKTGKHEHVPASTVAQATIAFPGEDLKGTKKVDATRRGQLVSVDPKDVDFQVKHPHTLYSPATTLVPFIESMQGNRALMAAKMGTQALCLKDREVPLIQVGSYLPNKSMEQFYGAKVVPVAPVAGKVERVDNDFIYIRPHTTKKTAERHPAERLQQRTTLHPDILDHLDNVAESLTEEGVTDTSYHLPLPFNQGTAVFKRVVDGGGPRLVLATILGPGMSARDTEPLPKTHYARMFKSAEDAFVKVAADEAGLVKVPYMTNYPLGTKSFLHNELSVKAGDEVHEGQTLGESNYTRGDTMALGKNLRTGLMAYHGLNSNDAIVISESASKKLTSVHMYREKYEIDDLVTGKEKHRTYFGNKYTRAMYEKLDEDGCVKRGTKVEPGDIIFAGLAQAALSAESAMLGKLHKSLVKPYRDAAHTWEHEFPGEVLDVFKTGKTWAITVKTEEPMQVGDKVSGRFGNKGVVSSIISDDQMVRDSQGRPLDLLYTSLGIISRINPAQVLEMGLGKVAEKTGKPIAVPPFTGKNNVAWVKEELKKHDLTDKETVFDPRTGKHVKGIMVGPQYFYKLMKTTNTNYGARGIDGYDVNEQPSKGGVEGAKGLGRMEFAGMVAHNARDLLKEQSLIRSQRNDEFWRRLQFGLPPLPPKTTFAYNKFGAMLTASGIKMDKSGSRISLGALTDKDVAEMSAGQVQNPLSVRAKDLKPEEGGLFDPAITGGLNGTKWTHVDLHEPVVNPVFEDAARRFLGMTGPQFKKTVAEKGAGHIRNELAKLDLDALRADLKQQTKTLRGSPLDSAVKQVKFIDALKKQGLKADEAFVLSKIPVIPPVMRPVLPGPRGNLMVNDANYLYRDLMLANDKLKVSKDTIQTPESIARSRTHLHDAAAALFGLQDPVSPQNASRGVKGFLTNIAGFGTPKGGFFQSKLIKRQLDLSGRSTIAPDTTLAMDQIGIPEDMLWTMFGPFIVGRLIRKGYEATRAKKMVEERAPAAVAEMQQEAAARPVIYNRAPSLHRYNLISAYPVSIPGKTIRLPAAWSEPMMNADFDGNCFIGTSKVTLQIPAPLLLLLQGDHLRPTEENMKFNAATTVYTTSTDSALIETELQHVPYDPASLRYDKNGAAVYTVPSGVSVWSYSHAQNAPTLSPVTHITIEDNCPTATVTTRGGFEVTASTNESLCVYNHSTGEVTECTPADAIGKLVPVTRRIPFMGIGQDFETGWMIGAFVSDGFFCGNESTTFGYTKVSDAHRDRFAAAVSAFEGVAVKRNTYRDVHDATTNGGVAGGSVKDHFFRASKTAALFRQCYLEERVPGRSALSKILPPLGDLSPQGHVGLLAGLLDGDGCVSISNGKAKPQVMVNFATSSRALVTSLQTLGRLLGIRMSVTATEPRAGRLQKVTAYTVTLSTVDLKRYAGVLLEKALLGGKAREAMELLYSSDLRDAKDIVPVPDAVLALALDKKGPYGSNVSRLSALRTLASRRRPSVYLARSNALQMAQTLTPLGNAAVTNWTALLAATDVHWDIVETVTPAGNERVYDLEVPDTKVFSVNGGLVVWDTMQIHTPITRAGVEDAKRMTIPNMLFADRSKGKLFVEPQHEAITGAFKATASPMSNKPTRKFKSREDALAAWRKGEIELNDPVEVKE